MKKGFTLIELLAVILILGIIALIAIPTVNNIINQTKVGAFKSTYNGIVKAAEQKCMSDKITGKDSPNTYNFVDGKSMEGLSVKGKLPESGYVQVSDDCTIMSAYIKDDKLAAKKSVTEEVIVGKIEDGKVRYESSNDEYKIRTDTVGLSGAGTKEDPYQISSIEDLVYLSKNSTSYIKSYMVLTTSLDFKNPNSYINSERTDMNFETSTDSLIKNLTSGSGFRSISSEYEMDTDNFYFDGKGHTIKNLYINRNYYAGLFGKIYFNDVTPKKEFVVENLNIEDAYINSTTISGALLGFIDNGTVKLKNINVSANGKINSGVIGYLEYSNIEANNIFIEGNIKTESNYMGGLIGDMSGSNLYAKINNVINTMDITTTRGNAGGILGDFRGVNEFDINNVTNFGIIKSQGLTAGLFVLNGSSSITEKKNIKNVYNFGTINGHYQAGGIAAGGVSNFNNANNYGNIYCDGSDCYGIAERFGQVISNSNNYGEVHGTYNISGIINSGTVTNCTNYGNIYGNDSIGGLCSASYCTITSSTNKGKLYLNGVETEIGY